ncbi:hypothetical protein [Xylophilus sp.]|uniref:hypothetical protein n=1 Tax=Xylophilus sp. TaxID=2653893 RepID=UPI0013BCB1DE|nr:hypothetical protein [Xylophilus sp.]KAF1044606.1 MAG: hypothetical protein GAK38_03441 [Xylophilus sp.]
MTTSIQLDPAVEQRQELVERSLADLDDCDRADAIAQRVRSGQEKVVSLEDAERDLGLAD